MYSLVQGFIHVIYKPILQPCFTGDISRRPTAYLVPGNTVCLPVSLSIPGPLMDAALRTLPRRIHSYQVFTFLIQLKRERSSRVLRWTLHNCGLCQWLPIDHLFRTYIIAEDWFIVIGNQIICIMNVLFFPLWRANSLAVFDVLSTGGARSGGGFEQNIMNHLRVTRKQFYVWFTKRVAWSWRISVAISILGSKYRFHLFNLR